MWCLIVSIPDLCLFSYLDTIFENTLKFDSYISHVVNSTNKLLGLIKRTFKALNEQSFLALYKITKKDLLSTVCDCGIS